MTSEFLPSLAELQADRSLLETMLEDVESLLREAHEAADGLEDQMTMCRNLLAEAEGLWREQQGRTKTLRTVEQSVKNGIEQVDEIRRRIAAAAALQETLDSKLCVACRKRPRRFDDLCGRCAEAQGTRTRGKIGT